MLTTRGLFFNLFNWSTRDEALVAELSLPACLPRAVSRLWSDHVGPSQPIKGERCADAWMDTRRQAQRKRLA